MVDNRKTRYTRRVIRESYCEILTKKQSPKVTVKELCEVADINKGTFYNHYDSIYDLQEELENEIVDLIKETIEKGDYHTQDKTGYAVLKILYEQRDVIRPMILGSSDASLWNKLNGLYTARSVWMWENTDAALDTILMATKYILAIHNAIQREWILNGYTESIEDINKISLAVLERIEDLFFETEKVASVHGV